MNLPTPNLYVKAGIVIGLLFVVFCAGFYVEHLRLVAYQESVTTAGKVQEAKNQAKDREHALITKGIQNDYDAKLAVLRRYYADGVRSSSTSPAGGISTTASLANERAAYNTLAGQCAQTTLQLVELQSWIKQQVGIANDQ